MMKIKLLLLAILLLANVPVSAKVGKIKYGKHIRYEGIITKNQATGSGALKVYDVENKEKLIFAITGEFSTLNNIKNIENESYGKYDLTTLKVSNGILPIKDGWVFKGELVITLDEYKKMNACVINTVLENGKIVNTDESIEIVVSKRTCKVFSDKNNVKVSFSPNFDDEMVLKVEKCSKKQDVLIELYSMKTHKPLSIDGLEGKAFLKDGGNLDINEGKVTSYNSRTPSFSVKKRYGNLLLTSYSLNGVNFDSNYYGLYIKSINSYIPNYSLQAEVDDIDSKRYKGTINDNNDRFSGKFLIDIDSPDLEKYTSLERLKQLVRYESGTLNAANGNNYDGTWSGTKFEGTLSKGKEKYVGSWDENHNFQGTYNNEDLLINLKECTVQDGIMKGTGERMLLPDSVIYSGPFLGTQRCGEGSLKYKSYKPIFGIWENDKFVKGQTTIVFHGYSYPYEIIPTENGYDYISDNKKEGSCETLPDLFSEIREISKEKCLKEILSSSDVSKANRLFKGEEFFGTLDPGILFDNGVDAELGRDLFDKIGTLCLDVNFTSYNECIYHVYLDTSNRSGGYNSMDLLLGGDPFASDLLFGVLRATMSDFEQKIKCIYTVKNDSIIMYKANSLELCDRMKILNNGQKLQAKQKRGYMTISKVR